MALVTVYIDENIAKQLEAYISHEDPEDSLDLVVQEACIMYLDRAHIMEDSEENAGS